MSRAANPIGLIASISFWGPRYILPKPVLATAAYRDCKIKFAMINTVNAGKEKNKETKMKNVAKMCERTGKVDGL